MCWKKGRKRRKKEEKQSANVSTRLLASVLGPGACRGPVAHGRDEVLVSSPDGLVQNPGV